MTLINGKGMSLQIHHQKALGLIFTFLFLISGIAESLAQRQMEKLDRGVVATYTSGKALVSWRIFGDDISGISFNLYQIVNGGTATKVNATPISGKSNYLVSNINANNTTQFYVTTVINNIESVASKAFSLKGSDPFISIPLSAPVGGIDSDNEAYTYRANDCSVGDLDGDGDYEIILKWDPTNSSDNTPSGTTGNTYFDAYTLEGSKLWRIDLGINIRSGAHYVPFMVFDLDGDGKAEIACKTAPGTKDASGNYISKGPAANTDHSVDYRNAGGMILSGPEFLTIFNGLTGLEMFTVYYTPRRHPDTEDPTGEQIDDIWGDNYGNRVDRFLACIAYLDGVRPSLVMCRGYYSRTVLAAYDLRGGDLSQRWVFDTMDEGNGDYAGQGNHGLTVTDVDGDGKDEIIYGSMTVDDNGKGLYSTGLGHGDAMHVSDLDPSRPGLEVFQVHESGGNGSTFRDAETGDIIWQRKIPGADIGRGVAFDIDPNYPGAECWSADGKGIFSCATGELITTTYPVTAGNGENYNMAAWWDGDLLRELIDKTVINKWNWTSLGTSRILSTYNYGVTSNNSTKSNPCLIADVLGDWREELIYRRSDNTALYIFTTPKETNYGIYTLMHDPQYRLSVAWQNVGYNQPAHTSFFLGADMETPPTPEAIYIDASEPFPADDTKPALATIDDQLVTLDADCMGLLPDYSLIANVTDENFTSFNYFQSPAAGTYLAGLGDVVKVELYVNDGNGNNSNMITFDATAIDATPPSITKAYGNHSLRANSSCEKALPDYTQYVTASDDCSSNLTITMQPAAGTILSGNGDAASVTISVDDNNGNITDTTFIVTLSAPNCFAASVDDQSIVSASMVYPNPTTGKLNLSKNYKEIEAIKINTLLGEEVYFNNTITAPVLDITHLPTGIYLIEVTISENTSTQKIVKY